MPIFKLANLKRIVFYLFIIIVLPFGQHMSVHAQNQPSSKVPVSIQLKNQFKKQAKQRIVDLERAILMITDKSIPKFTRDEAVTLAVSFFRSKEQQFEVSNVHTGKVTAFKVEEYLVRLNTLRFDRIEIKWVNIEWAEALEKASDGSYYGTVKVIQTFKGFRGEQLAYTDITTKTIEVQINMFNHLEGGGNVSHQFQILLGDVRVTETRRG